MSVTKVGLVQINNSFSGQNYFPYSVGLLQAYAEKYLKNLDQYEFLLPVYSRIKIDEAVELLKEADIVLFSAYVWNVRLSLKIAEVLKNQKPEIIIVFGGPHVPDKAEEFLKQNPFIDLACHKEGEKIIVPLLENCNEKNWEEVPSTSYIDINGEYIKNTYAPRIRYLDEVPSPYLEGAFDKLMESNPDGKWLMMWETNRGCPFSCAFCDWGSATQSKVNQFGLERLYKEIDWIKDNKIEFIFCADANFGILKRDFEIAQYAAKSKDTYGYPQALSVQNTKNARDRAYKVQKFLSDHGLNKGVTLALQSLDESTLKHIKRDNISLDDYKVLQHRFTKDKIETYTDMIIGLPGETYESFIDGISRVIENGQHNRIQYGNLSILPNAEMGDPEYQKKFEMEVIETNIINMHGNLTETEEIYETQQLVISTNSMPKEDWVKTRAFCWMSAFLHFDKVMQIPFILLHKLGDITYRELIEVFTMEQVQAFPVLSEIRDSFINAAKRIQNGGSEFCESKKWLNLLWPDDELQLIKLCTENRLEEFYSEAEALLNLMLKEKFVEVPKLLLHEAIQLNQSLIKYPFQKEDLEINFSYNIWEFYQNQLIGVDIPIEEKPSKYLIDRTTDTWSSWDQWCQEVIWYGNKKGAYLYKLHHSESTDSSYLDQNAEEQIEGHY